MSVNVRWMNDGGQRKLLVTLPSGQMVIIEPNTAWELITELRWCLMADVPGHPDNDQGRD